MKHFFQAAYDELLRIFHDQGIMIFTLILPIAYPLVYAYIYTNETLHELPTAVVDDCKSSLSREFIRNVDATPDVHILSFCPNMKDAEKLLKEQKVYGIVYIPRQFGADIEKGEQTSVKVYCDMASMLYYKCLALGVNNVALDMGKKIKGVQVPVTYEEVMLYNPTGGFASFLIPAVLMLILQQSMLLGLGASMGGRREQYGDRSGLPLELRKPTTAIPDILGRSLVYLCIYIIMAVYAMTCITDWFTLPHLGHFYDQMVFVATYLTACLGFAMLFTQLIYRREDSMMIFVFTSVPFLFMSGISWPVHAIPDGWRYFSYLVPSTFGMNGYVRLANMGAHLADVHKEWVALMLQAATYFTCAMLLYLYNIRKGKQSE